MHLFGDPGYFPAGRRKYTLEPLKAAGRKSLTCAGVDGLLDVTLKEIELRGHGGSGVRDRTMADDVFSVFEERRFQIPERAEIRLAKFSVLFRDARKPRTVILRPSNLATFSRDDDAVPLHGWLQRQNFALPNRDESNENWHLEYS